jgi:hypothetical protein
MCRTGFKHVIPMFYVPKAIHFHLACNLHYIIDLGALSYCVRCKSLIIPKEIDRSLTDKVDNGTVPIKFSTQPQ